MRFSSRLTAIADDIEAEARRRPGGALFLLLCWAAGLRGALWVLVALAGRIPIADLSLLYDGHLYLLVARTFPRLYGDIHPVFPVFRDSRFLTGYFPAHPLMIYLIHFAVGDWRLASLITVQLASLAAIALFFRIAREARADRPYALAALFAVFPTTWLVCGSFNLCEAVFCFFFMAAFYCHWRRRYGAAAALAAVAILAQKSGIVLFALFPLLAALDGKRSSWRQAWPYLLSPLPLALLQLRLYLLFGDPLMNLHVQQEVWQGPFFSFPFSGMISGLTGAVPFLSRVQPPKMRRCLLACSLFFYAGGFVLGLRRRDPEERPFLIWLGIVLLFNASLRGISGYDAFPRYMTVAAPAAWILWGRRRLPAPAIYAAVLLAPTAFVIATHGALESMTVSARYWGPAYFELLTRSLAAGHG